ncbi:Putative transglutaminase-like protein [Mycobacteroides abscessus subsp. abscessus]|nr:Putative transglutaminase-like protein [Mycobacteroides abscessus subsp. abscessus]
MKRDIRAQLDVDILEPSTLEFQVAVSPLTGAEVSEELSLELNGRRVEAHKFFGFAAAEFGEHTDPAVLLEKVSSWVGARLTYSPGSSDPIDGAVDTLLSGAGVCRDYAHLVVALLRAVKVPARLVAVYAPGCDPMDFHAVAEAVVDNRWRVVDATCLAPRQTMVRITTGRDAADTAFLDNHGGQIVLNESIVAAVVDGELPEDHIDHLVSMR